MRVALIAAGILLAAATPVAAPPTGWKPDVKAARTFALSRAGAVSFHVRTERGRWSFDADRSVASASVIKAMLLVAYLSGRRCATARSTPPTGACWTR